MSHRDQQKALSSGLSDEKAQIHDKMQNELSLVQCDRNCRR